MSRNDPLPDELNITLRWVSHWLKHTTPNTFGDTKVRQLCYDLLHNLQKHEHIESFNMETGVIRL